MLNGPVKSTALLAAGLLSLAPHRSCATGSWLISGNPAPAAVGIMLLLPDGTVMAANNPNITMTHDIGYVWYRLVPDINGHYVNGLWYDGGAMHDTRLAFSSQVVPDGRLFVAGGEYGGGMASAEIFNPQANNGTGTWTYVSPPASLLDPSQPAGGTFSGNPNQAFLDANSMMLPDGRVILTPVLGKNYGECLVYNPRANTWTNEFNPATRQSETTWVKLPDGSILTIDPQGDNGGSGTNTERFIPALGKWIPDAQVPVNLWVDLSAAGAVGEIGPALLLPSGKAFYLGGNGHSAIYTPSGTTNFGSWQVGPDLPYGLSGADAPAAMMVNGRILCAVAGTPYVSNGKVIFPNTTSFFEYDYRIGTNGQFSQVSGPTGTTDDVRPQDCSMLMLPDASVMFCDSQEQNFPSSGAKVYYYYPDNNAQVDFGHAPTITSVTLNPDGTYHLVGTGLNGLSAGASFGDDKQMDSNYPLVEFIDPNNGQVSYGRTFNWSSTGVQTGSAAESTDFALPDNLSLKTYNLVVTASGVASAPVAFSFVQPSYLALCPGDDASLTATAPPGPATYQWLSNGVPIPGQTGLTLNFIAATTNQSAYYSLKVTSATGYTISPPVPVSVGVWVLGPPSATNSATLCQPKTLSLTAQGKGTLSAQWFRNGVPIDLATDPRISTNNLQLPGGATELSLSFTDVRYQDDGTYTVAITDACETITNAPFTMRVVPNPPWVLVATNGPSARYQAAMTYDFGRHVAVLFGGEIHHPTGSPLVGDTWEFDGTNWTQRFPLNSPTPRSQAQMVYDLQLGRCILFGGQIFTNNQFQLSLETWEWDGTNWSQVITPHVPGWTLPDQFSACYDNFTGGVLAFGGLTSTGRVSQLWSFDGADWTQKIPSGPAPVTPGSTLMLYDIHRQVAVLLGCNSQAYPSPYQQAAVWEWDGTSWLEKPQSGQVFGGASALDGFVYDPFRRECVLYGNVFGIVDGVLSSGYTPYPDGYRFVWRWDGQHWQADPPTPTLGVTQSLYPSMCFDFARNAIDLFGGLETGNLPVTNFTYEILYQDDPAVLKQPTILARLIGQNVQLSVLAAGAPPISYQWSKDGMNLADNGHVTGSLTSTLTINSATVVDSGQYTLTMNNLCGLGVSQPITLNVTATTGGDIVAIAVSGTNSAGSAQSFILTWGDTNAELQSSTNPVGPWITVTGAVSPYPISVDPAMPKQFFRLLIP